MEFNIRLSNRQILKGMIESPGESTRAVVILVHGLGEHINRYKHWAAKFKSSGFGFLGVDLPGHGQSEGRRGIIKNYSLTDEMIDILLTTCKRTFPGCPIYLYGHSLGGGLVLDYLVRKNPKIKGAIVTSPWLRLTFEPARSKVIMASLLKNLIPGFTQGSGLNTSHLSHDEEVIKKYIEDPLVHGKISISLFNEAMNAAKYALNHASELRVRTLLMHGSDDRITSPEGSREFADKSNLVSLKIWEGSYHEIHNEPFSDEVFKYILNWINMN